MSTDDDHGGRRDETRPVDDHETVAQPTVPQHTVPDPHDARDPHDAPVSGASPGADPAPSGGTGRRRRVLAVVGLAAAGLLLLGGAFAGGVALGATIDGPGSSRFVSEQSDHGPHGDEGPMGDRSAPGGSLPAPPSDGRDAPAPPAPPSDDQDAPAPTEAPES